MDRRTLIISGLSTLSAVGVSKAAWGQDASPSVSSQPLPPATAPGSPARTVAPGSPGAPLPTTNTPPPANTYTEDEIVGAVSNFLGVAAESAGAAVERIFAKNGRPTAYIAGEEGSAAIVVGARYGRGMLYMKERQAMEVYWQGPSAGWDFGGNASRVFTLCYNLMEPEVIFQRFPGVEGSAYLIGGLGVNYQRAGGVTLAPIRTGVGLRLGANLGYLSYTRKRNAWPF